MLGVGSPRDIQPIVTCFNHLSPVLERFDTLPETLTLLTMESVNVVFKAYNRQYEAEDGLRRDHLTHFNYHTFRGYSSL